MKLLLDRDNCFKELVLQTKGESTSPKRSRVCYQVVLLVNKDGGKDGGHQLGSKPEARGWGKEKVNSKYNGDKLNGVKEVQREKDRERKNDLCDGKKMTNKYLTFVGGLKSANIGKVVTI